MKDTMLMPCSDWSDKLAVRKPEDLSPSARLALNEHMEICPACASVYSAYHFMELSICNLPLVEPLPGLPEELLRLEESSVIIEELELLPSEILRWPKYLLVAKPNRLWRRHIPSIPGLLEHAHKLGMAFTSVVVSVTNIISKKLHAVLACLPQKVIYINSSNRYVYALQGNSGSILWKYKQSDVFFSAPAVMNGSAYLTSFDSQMFLFASRVRPLGNSFLWK
jgi:PQQ enzyme repeat